MKRKVFTLIFILFLIQCQLLSFFDIPSYDNLVLVTVQAEEKETDGFSAVPYKDAVNIKTEIIPLPDIKDTQETSLCYSDASYNIEIIKRICENGKLNIKINSLNIIEFERLIE